MTRPSPYHALALVWDDEFEEHVAPRNITGWECREVFDNQPRFRENAADRTADYAMYGVTDAGRRLRVYVVWDDDQARTLRAVTAWDNR